MMNYFAMIGTLGILSVPAQTPSSPAAAPVIPSAPRSQGAQPPPPARFGPSPEQQAKTDADHKALLETLKITSLRPGLSGNPSAPDAANSDESKAGVYALPDPLVFNNGAKVADAKQWGQRRRELFDAFDREIYGRAPKVTPKVSWEVV